MPWLSQRVLAYFVDFSPIKLESILAHRQFDHNDAFDQAMRVAAVLPADQLDVAQVVLAQDGIVKHQAPIWRGNDVALRELPR